VGEVLNTTNRDIDYVRVYVTMYNEKNEVIGTSSAITEPSTILALDSASFKLHINNIDVQDINKITKYKIRASTK
jgi:hypothetical protein